MNNSLHVVTKKYRFYEAKSMIRNNLDYTEETVKKAKKLVSAHYKNNPHLLEPINKVDPKEIQRIKLKYKIK